MQHRSRAGEHGQSLVLVALWLTVLLGFAAVAVDIGRFYTERRFLQNAADAAALAGANALIAGRTNAEAEAIAREVLLLNLVDDPTGNPPAPPPLVPVYQDGHAGEPAYLSEGILVADDGVRVAVRNPVDYTLGKAVGLVEQDIGARSYASWDGGLLPIAVRQFLHPPGPAAGVTSPCSDDPNRFLAVFATAATACLGSDSNASGRVDPSAGAAFDPANPDNDRTNHGPIVAILGQRATPTNASDFRGFIALDIRNFSTASSQRYYNGVTPTTNENALKDLETGWILRGGYPGPGFPPITSPPDPMDQVAILSGNSAGLAVASLDSRYALGDEILVAVYPGYVMAIPDFLVASPGTIALPATGVTDTGSFRVSRNQAFSGSVTLSTLADTLDPANPMLLGTLTTGASGGPITYVPNPVYPSLGSGERVDMEDITTAGATPGIYALWLQGQAGSPYLTVKRIPFAVRIGDVTRDFALRADATGKVATNAGDTVTFTLTLENSPNRNNAFGGPVTLSVDGPLPSGVGPVTLSSTSVTPTRDGATVTLSVNTGTLPQNEYVFVVRATGMNADPTPRKVTRLLPLTVNVAPTSKPGSDEYIDITGFAVMRVAAVDSNTVEAYAITPVITDPSDPRLRRGRAARLLPW